jgi:hypothetical protein
MGVWHHGLLLRQMMAIQQLWRQAAQPVVLKDPMHHHGTTQGGHEFCRHVAANYVHKISQLPMWLPTTISTRSASCQEVQHVSTRSFDHCGTSWLNEKKQILSPVILTHDAHWGFKLLAECELTKGPDDPTEARKKVLGEAILVVVEQWIQLFFSLNVCLTIRTHTHWSLVTGAVFQLHSTILCKSGTQHPLWTCLCARYNGFKDPYSTLRNFDKSTQHFSTCKKPSQQANDMVLKKCIKIFAFLLERELTIRTYNNAMLSQARSRVAIFLTLLV